MAAWPPAGRLVVGDSLTDSLTDSFIWSIGTGRSRMQGAAPAVLAFFVSFCPCPAAARGAGALQDEQASPLGFVSKRAGYEWDRIIPLDLSVDGLSVKSIFFNSRGIAKGPFRGATFGTRAQVSVVNMSGRPKNIGVAVAVFDDADRLLGVASGGNTLGVVRPGKAASFDMNFTQVKERLRLGAYFVVSVELVD